MTETYLIRGKVAEFGGKKRIDSWLWVNGAQLLAGRRNAEPMVEETAIVRLAEVTKKFKNWKFELIPNE